MSRSQAAFGSVLFLLVAPGLVASRAALDAQTAPTLNPRMGHPPALPLREKRS